MKVLFVDPRGAYGAHTSADLPLGGTQSAVAYLAGALGRAGVGVCVANLRPDDVVENDVAWLSLARLQQQFAANLRSLAITHVVVVSAAAVGHLRARVAWNAPWVLWNHHWIDQPALASLRDPASHGAWDAVVSLSRFHYDGMAHAFGLAPARHHVLRNAISPHFAQLFADWEQFCAGRAHRATVRFAYTSTPFRGLDVLVQAWDELGRQPGWSCTVISGMQLYGRSDDGEFAPLLERAGSTAGMSRLAPVGQAHLAPLLAGHDFWGYPCTFVETSCISALEAVAAGLYPVTTALGALPETLEGWGAFVAPGEELAVRWTAAARACAREREAAPESWLRAAWARRQRVVREWTWAGRAQEWIAFLAEVSTRAGAGAPLCNMRRGRGN